MLGVRFNSGIDAWVNDRVVVTWLMNCLLYIFQEVSFSQMNNLVNSHKILMCENACKFTNASCDSYRANHNRPDWSNHVLV